VPAVPDPRGLLTRVDRLVYVTAFVPELGRSIVDIAGTDVREAILSVSRDDGNGCRSFDLELLAAVEQPWPGRSLPDMPCTYVLWTEDSILPLATQREMAAGLGVEPVELASDHAVFTLRPRELAPLLVG
jgi:hypothetical protein